MKPDFGRETAFSIRVPALSSRNRSESQITVFLFSELNVIMKIKNRAIAAILFALVQASCTSNPKYTGTPLKLDEALAAVGEALQTADRAGTGGKNSGLVPAEVTVGFNITNASTDGGNVQLNVVPVPSVSAAGGWAGSRSSQIGSAITIKYSSLLLAGADSIVGSRPAAASNSLVRDISRENLSLKRQINILSKENSSLKMNIESLKSDR